MPRTMAAAATRAGMEKAGTAGAGGRREAWGALRAGRLELVERVAAAA